MPMLRVDQGDRHPEIIHLRLDKVVLGRSPDCDEVVSEDEVVSRWHAQVLRVNDRTYIEDLKSKNKTYINGEELPPYAPRPLTHNDSIIIGDFRATFLETLPDPVEEGSSTIEAMLSSSNDHSLETQPAAKLAALLEITAKLSKTLQLDTQLPQVADELLLLFPQADRCFLILVDEASGKLIPEIVKARGNVDTTIQHFSRTIVRQCLQSADSILLCEGDKALAASTTDSVITSNIRSVMCVPLRRAVGPPFGIIQLDTQDPGKRFTPDDLRLLWGVAHQAAIAMENARYHKEILAQERIKNDMEIARQTELREAERIKNEEDMARQAQMHELRLAKERVENELKIARQVQLNFLPKDLPNLPGYEFHAFYEAAREVGGDYYDFIPLSENRLAITLGDVAGKGMPAALLMARLSSESRSCLLTERKPAEAIARLNDQLYPFTSPMDRFITLIAAVLDPATHTVTLVNAGHPTPLLYRHADHQFHKAVPDEDDGQSLGHALANRYQCYQVTLAPGDSLLLFTDGVTDAQSVANKSFRMKGIYNLLEQKTAITPRTLGERLVAAVQAHAKGGPQYDDITLICFGRPTS